MKHFAKKDYFILKIDNPFYYLKNYNFIRFPSSKRDFSAAKAIK